MDREPIPLLGGKSVHCINEQQMAEARRITGESKRIQELIESLEQELSRNERASLAFVLIERLKSTAAV